MTMHRRARPRQHLGAREEVEAGQAIYSPMVLRLYDWWVLGVSSHLIWRCPTAKLRRLYDRNVSRRHLDLGVGTGYFLDKARWPVPDPEIVLLDLNRNSLDAASRRIRRYGPRSILANVLEPLPQLEPFGSVGLCYLLHCLPGDIPRKSIVFDHVRPVLASDARVFGATIVAGDAPRSSLARALMNVYNRKRIFSNARDTIEDLDAALRQRFRRVKIELSGNVAIFEASAER